MSKRFATVAVGIALALQIGPAAAGPYYGYDGRSYGELESAPNYGRPAASRAVTARPNVTGGGSRRGLTPAARALLGRIESKFGPVNVISGYRPGARIAGTGRVSRHASGNAIDFEAGGRKGAIVRWLVANHHSGGTMTYSGMSHVHVDIGPHFVSLGSGSGRSASRSRSRNAQRYADRNARDYGYRRARRPASDRDRRVHWGGQRQFASGYATIYR